MNIVFGARILLCSALLFVFLALPKLLGSLGVQTLAWMLNPVITMTTIIVVGLIASGPLLMNPARAFILLAMIILVAALVTWGMYYGALI